MNYFKTLIILFFLQSVYLKASPELPFKITGIYSSLSFNEESGDLLGNELIVVFSKNGYVVIYQSSEGDPSVPVITQAIINGREISFLLPDTITTQGIFTGEISSKGLNGKFQTSGQVLDLNRKNSYWQ